MNGKDFGVLVARLEKSAARNPGWFGLRILALIALAYGYLAALLCGTVLTCLLLAGLILLFPGLIKLWVLGLFIAGGTTVIAWRSLNVKLRPPAGRVITPAEAPKLFEQLNALTHRLDCRPFHRVLLTFEDNAAVTGIPRWGLFGPSRNYLQLGLPLMLGLSPEEFQAVLVHELAHCSRGHNRFGNWVYRTHRTWERIIAALNRQGAWFSGMFLDFFDWFWPRFHAHAFVLSRTNEYEADACSIRSIGPAFAARALIRHRLNSNLLGKRFWPGLFERAAREAEPPADVLLEMGTVLRAGLGPEEAEIWLRQALQEATGNADTHPALNDRLQAMKVEAAVPPPLEMTAGVFYLGGHLNIALRQLSRDWQRWVEADWRRCYHQANWALPVKRTV